MSKVLVDQVKCIGCGLCVSIADKVFKMNEQGKSEAIGGCEGDEECEEKIKEAVESCPVQAISRKE
ncbi:MAG: ferredoxin [Microgenomates group bacterium]